MNYSISRSGLISLLLLLTMMTGLSCKPNTTLTSEISGDDDNLILSAPAANAKILPALEVKDLNGGQLNLASLKGKKVFVNLWATWCPPCVAELPSIQALYSTAKSDSVAFVMLSFDEDPNTAREFMAKKGYDMPVYYAIGDLPDLFNVSGIPSTFIFDENGKLVFDHTGMANFNKSRFRKFLGVK